MTTTAAVGGIQQDIFSYKGPEETSRNSHAEPVRTNEVLESDHPGALYCHVSLSGKSRVSDTLVSYANHLTAKNRSKHTVSGFILDVSQLAEFLPNMLLAQISTRDLEAFFDCIAHGIGNNKKASAATLYRKHTALKNYFRWLHKSGIIEADPSSTLAFTKKDPPLPSILDSQEAARFIEASKEVPLDHIAALLLLGAGLKRSEVLALTVHDIDVSNPVHPTVRIEGSHAVQSRTLTLAVEFRESYLLYLKLVHHDVLPVSTVWSGNPADLAIRAGETPPRVFPINERLLNYLLEKIALRSLITKVVSCQILRDSYAVHLIQSGEDIESVIEKLGLSKDERNASIRRKYTRLSKLLT